MTNIRTLVAETLRNTLINNGEAPKLALVADDTYNYKIFLGIAPGDATPPYILMNHVYGGERRRSPRREFEHLWEVVGVSTSQPEAEELHSLIFTTLVPYRPATFGEDWVADQNINDQGETASDEEVEGVQYFRAGNYLQIRGSKRIYT
jgi:hypothetical protein